MCISVPNRLIHSVVKMYIDAVNLTQTTAFVSATSRLCWSYFGYQMWESLIVYLNHMWRRIWSSEVTFTFYYLLSHICAEYTLDWYVRLKDVFHLYTIFPFDRVLFCHPHISHSFYVFHIILLSLLLRLPFPLYFANVNGKQSVRWQQRICSSARSCLHWSVAERECSGLGQFSVSDTLVSIALDVSKW